MIYCIQLYIHFPKCYSLCSFDVFQTLLSQIMEAVRAIIVKALPYLPEDLLNKLLASLVEDCGVEQTEDLSLICEVDLTKHLKPIQARKVLRLVNERLTRIPGKK